MHDVEVARCVVRVDQVAQLDGCAGLDALRFAVHEAALDRAGAVAGRAQQHVMPGGCEAAREHVDDQLGPAVRDRWNREPGRRDQHDPHARIVPPRPVTE